MSSYYHRHFASVDLDLDLELVIGTKIKLVSKHIEQASKQASRSKHYIHFQFLT